MRLHAIAPYLTAFLALGLLSIAPPAPAQVREPPPRADVLDLVRRGQGFHTASRFLADSTRGGQELDAFVDELIAIAAADAHSSSGPTNVSMSVLSIIGAAGRGTFGRVYPQAEEKHMLLYEAVDDGPFRGAVLYGIRNIGLPPGRVLAILEAAVMADDLSALAAVGYLAEEGPAGMQYLRRIYRDHLDEIASGLARRQLKTIAKRQGWGGGGR